MRVYLTKPARAHLLEIESFIAIDNPIVAADMVLKINQVIFKTLEPHPFAGYSGKVGDTRELIIAGTPYIVVYRILEQAVQVLAILHSSQRWPKRFPSA